MPASGKPSRSKKHLQKAVMKLTHFLVAFTAKETDLTQNFGPVIDRRKAAVVILDVRCRYGYFFGYFIKVGVIAAIRAGNSHD